MTKNELKELMEYLSAIDNRQLSAEKLQVWFDLIGYLDFDDAKAAVIEAQREQSISYVEAKHVIAIALSARIKAKAAKQQAEARKPVQQALPRKRSGPHNQSAHTVFGLLSCDPCCRNAAIQAGLIKADTLR
jgi:hypothetical protein